MWWWCVCVCVSHRGNFINHDAVIWAPTGAACDVKVHNDYRNSSTGFRISSLLYSSATMVPHWHCSCFFHGSGLALFWNSDLIARSPCLQNVSEMNRIWTFQTKSSCAPFCFLFFCVFESWAPLPVFALNSGLIHYLPPWVIFFPASNCFLLCLLFLIKKAPAKINSHFCQAFNSPILLLLQICLPEHLRQNLSSVCFQDAHLDSHRQDPPQCRVWLL